MPFANFNPKNNLIDQPPMNKGKCCAYSFNFRHISSVDSLSPISPRIVTSAHHFSINNEYFVRRRDQQNDQQILSEFYSLSPYANLNNLKLLCSPIVSAFAIIITQQNLRKSQCLNGECPLQKY